MIHQFSTTGILPRETSRRRFRLFISLLTIFCMVCVATYIICLITFYEASDSTKLMITNEVMATIRAVAVSFEGLVLVVTLWKLKRAKVKRTDSGHLNVCNAAFLLILQFF